MKKYLNTNDAIVYNLSLLLLCPRPITFLFLNVNVRRKQFITFSINSNKKNLKTVDDFYGNVVNVSKKYAFIGRVKFTNAHLVH